MLLPPTGSVPASPVTELSLSQIDDSIIYNINFAIENETNSPIIRNPTSFVFRIEDLDDTHYIWQVSSVLATSVSTLSFHSNSMNCSQVYLSHSIFQPTVAEV